jgi:hypothetical protein
MLSPETPTGTPTLSLPAAQLPTATEEMNPCLVDKKPGSYFGGLVPTAAAGTPSPQPILPTAEAPPPARSYWRAGFGVSSAARVEQLAAQLGAGWYLDWRAHETPPSAALEHWQMVRVSSSGTIPSLACLQYIARRNPGQTWIIGNEPDVIWQDNTPPERYAHLYGEVYRGLKSVDPGAKVAAGGIASVTPLRLAYLERVLTAYQAEYGGPLPADWWNIHVYVLREERGSWGIEIPPGEPADKGRLYQVSDHARIDLFTAQIRDFREWMARHGYRDTPLAITEFGVLMPPGYGFPPEVVASFLRQSFELLDSLQSAQSGLASDDHRLVQRWAWFSLADPIYSGANLVDLASGRLTQAGSAFQEFVKKKK